MTNFSNHIHFFLIIFFLAVISISSIEAQNFDCVNATAICGNTPISGNNSTIGIDDFANPNNQSGCLGVNSSTGAVEIHPNWYVFTTATSGLLEFTITPNDLSDDYDFALFGPGVACNNLGSPIRCNFSGTPGLTGISNTSSGGTFDNGLNVLAGETYYLLITNWSGSPFGFDLTWGTGVNFVADVQAAFIVSNQTCNQVSLQNNSSSCLPTIDSQWDFGDGNTSTSANPTHTYANSGTYTITLTASAGTYTSTFQQTVNVILPTATIDNLDTQYCINDAPANLQGTPTGGIFFIDGVANTVFDPQALGAGTYNVVYAVNQSGCNLLELQVVEVLPAPVTDIVGIQNNYCIDDNTLINITTSPVFDPITDILELDGVSATDFTPSALSLGTHTIHFEHTDAFGCIGMSDFTFTINDIPSLSISLNDSYCLTANTVTLTGTGQYTINGNPATEFNPMTLGAGNHLVENSYTDPSTNCSNTIQKVVEVYDLSLNPPTFSNLNTDYCSQDASFLLTGTPAGGNFYINGILNDTFDPQALGAGTHTVRYELVNPDPSCNQDITQNVVVHPEPSLQVLGVENNYCIDDNTLIDITTNPVFDPTTDILEVNGINTTSFTPSVLGLGTHTVHFEHTNNLGCTGTVDFTFNVQELPTVSINLEDSYCMASDDIPLLNGQYTINGNPATEFSPRNLGSGTHNVAYTYTNPSTSCSNTTDKDVVVLAAALPLTQDYEICSFTGKTLELDAGESDTYLWYEMDKPNFPLSQERIYKIEKSGTYQVIVNNNDGCETVNTFEVKEVCNTEFYVPNAFTPNNDGTNDVFQVFGKDFNKFEIQVLNRWGEVVYYSENKEETWDGTYRGKSLPTDIYVCIIKYRELPDGDFKQLKSKIHLIR